MSRTPCVARPIVEMPDTRAAQHLAAVGDQHDLVVVDHLRDADTTVAVPLAWCGS